MLTRIPFALLTGLLLAWTLVQTAPAGAETHAPEKSLRPEARAFVSFKTRWDHKPRAPLWSRAAVGALRSHASKLPSVVPNDIAEWCPSYPTNGRAQREAFWVGLLSTLSKHESTYRETAVGGGGLWYGLVQIYPDTARRYGCRAKTGDALKHGPDNLSCALRIMAVTVSRDQVVSRNMRGVAADWGPFHSARKRNDMKEWIRKQSYCTGLGKSLRPQARPLTKPEALTPAVSAITPTPIPVTPVPVAPVSIPVTPLSVTPIPVGPTLPSQDARPALSE